VSHPSTEFLKSVPLFSEVSERDLPGIARSLTRVDWPAGKTVTDKGSGGIGFFVVESGAARVSVDGRDVKTLGPGDYYGEIALLAGRARTATITADGDLVCWGMRQWVFTPMLKRQPSVGARLLEALAQQLSR
jgi:CRP-like cAMP-binding protein